MPFQIVATAWTVDEAAIQIDVATPTWVLAARPGAGREPWSTRNKERRRQP
jgi:hypothetical protein